MLEPNICQSHNVRLKLTRGTSKFHVGHANVCNENVEIELVKSKFVRIVCDNNDFPMNSYMTTSCLFDAPMALCFYYAGSLARLGLFMS